MRIVCVGGGPGGLYLAILPLGRPARAGGGRRDRPPGRVRLSTSRQQLLDPLTARAVGLGVRVDVDRELADLAQLADADLAATGTSGLAPARCSMPHLCVRPHRPGLDLVPRLWLQQ